MQKPLSCKDCNVDLDIHTAWGDNGHVLCGDCLHKRKSLEIVKDKFNEPEHYHKHNIDTIKFLQEGFPPEVFMGFAIGHIIKYA
jgi:hypothetical protein